MKKLLFIFLFPILAFGQKAFQPKSNGWWYLQGITTKPTHNIIGVRDSNSTSDKAQIRLFGDVTLNSQIGSGTRMLTVSPAGLISNQAIPTGGGSGTVTSISSANTDIAVATGTTTPVLTLNNINGVSKTYYDFTSSGQTQLNSKIGLNSISATSPIFYNNTTGVFSSQAATTSQNGYLTSTDWNTFNAKISNATGLLTAGTNVTLTGTGTSGSPFVINSTGGGITLPSTTKQTYDFLTSNESGVLGWRTLRGKATIPLLSDIKFFGTSFTAGLGLSSLTKGYPSILASTFNCTFTNYAVSGSQWFTAVQSAFTNINTYNINPSVVECGFNDMRAGGNTTPVIEQIKSGASAFIANQFLATAIPANSGSVTATGTWATNALATSKSVRGLSGLIRTSNTTGSTLTYSFTGTTLVIGTFSTDEINQFGEDFTYSVDGGTAVTYSGKNKASGSTDGSGNVMSLIPNAIVLFNLPSGSHSVVITTLNVATVRIDYFGSLKSPAECPAIIMAAVSKMSTAGYAVATGTTVNDVTMQAATAAQFSIADLFSSRGYPVFTVDQNNKFNVLTDIQADNIHPNDLGNVHFAESFTSVIREGSEIDSRIRILNDGLNAKGVLINSAGTLGLNINRNPYSGVYDDINKGSTILNLSTSSGDGHVDIFTTSTNNSTPTNTFTVDKYGQVVSKTSGVTAKAYFRAQPGSTNITWNYNIGANNYDNTGLPGAMIAMGGASGDAGVYFFGGTTNNSITLLASIDKSGNYSNIGNGTFTGGTVNIGTSTGTLNLGSQTIKDASTLAGGIPTSTQFKSGVANSRTTVSIIPNGTSTIADLWLFSSSDVNTNYSTCILGYEAGSGSWAFNTLKGGTNTVKPIYFNATGSATLTTANLVLKTTGVVQLPYLTTAGIVTTDASGNLSSTATGTTGKYLTSNGTIPQWSANTFTTDVQGIVNTNAERTLKTFQADVVQTGATAANLYSYSIPGGTMQDGDIVEFDGYYFGGNASSSVLFDVNGTNIMGISTGSAVRTFQKYYFIRLSSTTAKVIADDKYTTTVFTASLSSLDFTSAIPLTIRGQNTVTGNLGIVKFIPVK